MIAVNVLLPDSCYLLDDDDECDAPLIKVCLLYLLLSADRDAG